MTRHGLSVQALGEELKIPQHNKATFYEMLLPGGYSVVSLATHYGLDGPGIESQWG